MFLFRTVQFGLVGLSLLLQIFDLEELELESIHVLEGYDLVFDLSGITEIDQHYYVIGDKQHTRQLYQIQLDDHRFRISDSISLGYDQKSDMEGVDYCEKHSVYFTNEENNQAYVFTSTGRYELLFDSKQLDTSLDWGSNKGLEGIAVDCDNRVLYLAKEREPRFIISYDIEHRKVLNTIFKDSKGDISDLKFEGGFLYILERNENIVSKMDVKTNQIVRRVSYKNTCSHPRGKLYRNSKYGMAEALLLTADEIWIGLDNNGLPFSDYATETYGLTGNKPVIIKFKRPAGF